MARPWDARPRAIIPCVKIPDEAGRRGCIVNIASVGELVGLRHASR